MHQRALTLTRYGGAYWIVLYVTGNGGLDLQCCTPLAMLKHVYHLQDAGMDPLPPLSPSPLLSCALCILL